MEGFVFSSLFGYEHAGALCIKCECAIPESVAKEHLNIRRSRALLSSVFRLASQLILSSRAGRQFMWTLQEHVDSSCKDLKSASPALNHTEVCQKSARRIRAALSDEMMEQGEERSVVHRLRLRLAGLSLASKEYAEVTLKDLEESTEIRLQ